MIEFIDGEGYRIKEGLIAFLFEIEIKPEFVPPELKSGGVVGVVMPYPKAIWGVIISDEAKRQKVQEKAALTVGNILREPGRGLGLDPAIIESLKPVSYDRFLELSEGRDPLNEEYKPNPEPDGSASEFGPN